MGSVEVTHRRARGARGIDIHYVEAGRGSATRPPVVLLHGFPEFWYGWRQQIPALAEAGFHVIAPDLRGYNRSGKPTRVRDYRMELLVGDVAELVRHVGGGRVSLVGHDWGGIIAWRVAAAHPDMLDRLAILNAPHPAAYIRELWRNPAQLRKSWYAFFFQVPWLPEALVRSNDFALMRRGFRVDPARRGAFSRADIDRYVEAFSRRGALTGAINYYRAAFREGPSKMAGGLRRIDTPTLLVWGMKDRYLDPALTRNLERWVTTLRVERLENASHWVQHDEPETVNRLLIDFLS